uniref:TFR_dimer domain-containing protein n=1 Tax=Ascaris lumbricoides TaxID=6252 RepID=A0A0M3HU31_ASCLU
MDGKKTLQASGKCLLLRTRLTFQAIAKNHSVQAAAKMYEAYKANLGVPVAAGMSANWLLSMSVLPRFPAIFAFGTAEAEAANTIAAHLIAHYETICSVPR